MKPRILCVDDNTRNLDILMDLLDHDYSVSTASNGEEAIDKIKAASFDLVLLDVMMPGLSGFDVCQIIKHGTETRHIPVILVTACFEEAERQMGKDRGADAILTKPFDPNALLDLIEGFIPCPMKPEAA